MINEEFLKEQGIDETKHEAIISAFAESTKGLFDEKELSRQKGDAVRSMMEGYEEAAFKAYNIPKLDNEKASEYNIRSAKEYWTKHYEDKINELTTLNSELSEKAKNGIKDEELLQKYSALEQTLETERNTFKQEKETWESENTKREKLNAYKSLIPKLKEDIDPEYKKFKVDGLLDSLLGKEVVEADGKLLIKGDETNGFTNTLVDEYLKENLKGILDEKHVQTGTGRRPAGGGDPAVIDISDSDTPQAKEAKIRAYLRDKGMNTTSENYSEEFGRLRKKYILKK